MAESRALKAGIGARNDQTRRHNLTTILTALHHDGPQPRSQLTSRSGLNRSTVAALVSELTELGLVFESEPNQTNLVGRPSPTVHPDPDVMAIAVNPEVDAITVGLVTFAGGVIEKVRVDVDTPPTVTDAVAIAAESVARLRARHPTRRPVGVGVAVPGLVRAVDGLVRLAPHLGWIDEPVAGLLATATGLPVQAANDASLGAMAEKLFGAGRGKGDLVYLNGGASGIGGGIIANGRPLGGTGGYAGEFGHTRVAGGVGPCGDPTLSTLESMVNRADLLGALGLGSADADEFEAALLNATSAELEALVHRQLEFLSTSLSNAVNVLNPEIVVLGGFLASIFMRDPGFLIERVSTLSLRASFDAVEIVPATLGSDLLMIGAAELAFGPVLTDPAGGSEPAAAEA